jgi:GH18 family chitinase
MVVNLVSINTNYQLSISFWFYFKGFFERFNAWKSVNKNLKTLLAVGGWVCYFYRTYSLDLFAFSIGYGNERFCR